jgi:hypothetical protein
LPAVAADEVPGIEPRFDSGLLQGAGQRQDNRFVLAVV